MPVSLVVIVSIAATASLLVVTYLMPAAVAYWRKHPRRVAIFWLNMLLGWTLVGWVVALVYASEKLLRRPVEANDNYKRKPKRKHVG